MFCIDNWQYSQLDFIFILLGYIYAYYHYKGMHWTKPLHVRLSMYRNFCNHSWKLDVTLSLNVFVCLVKPMNQWPKSSWFRARCWAPLFVSHLILDWICIIIKINWMFDKNFTLFSISHCWLFYTLTKKVLFACWIFQLKTTTPSNWPNYIA